MHAMKVELDSGQCAPTGKAIVQLSKYLVAGATPRSNVTRMCKISEKRGKNKGKLYIKEYRLNKNTKNKKTPGNIR